MHTPTLLPNRPGPRSVFCSPAPLPNILSAYRTFPTDQEQQRLLLQYIYIICVAWLLNNNIHHNCDFFPIHSKGLCSNTNV